MVIIQMQANRVLLFDQAMHRSHFRALKASGKRFPAVVVVGPPYKGERADIRAMAVGLITHDYRLTTRAQVRRIRYPVPLDDVVAVVRSVQGENPGGVILGGASAGACLSSATVLMLASEVSLRGVFFAYGTFHAALPKPSAELRSRLTGRRRYTHTPPLIGLMNLNYAGSRAAMLEAFAFPGGHEVSGFPPSLLVDAERDIMRASGSEFAKELGNAGVPVEYHVMEGAGHAFLHRPRDPAFPKGIRLIAEWAKRL